MNKCKTSNLLRSIAFFLTAVVLTCTFGFTVDGWISPNQGNETPKNSSAKIPYLPGSPDDDHTKDDLADSTDPKYINPLTGEDLENDPSLLKRFAFIFDSSTPLYGISAADIVVEIPTEEESRYIGIYQGCENLWKIGSILPARGYISNVAKYFGATLVHYGNDDDKHYEQCDISKNELDLSSKNGYFYTEQDKLVFTNSELISTADFLLNDCQQNSIPLVFSNSTIPISSENKTNKIVFPSSEKYPTQLIYNSGSQKYSIVKNGEILKDYFDSSSLEFTNCLILFADSITYDTSDCSQMIMNTIGSGRGFCFTNGNAIEINWTGSIDGSLTFFTASGEILTVNRGRTYICFLGTSKSEMIEIS